MTFGFRGAEKKPAAKTGSNEHVKVESGKEQTQTADSAEFETPSRFVGVKSYLHQFYSPNGDGENNGWLLVPPPPTPNKYCVWLCRILFIIGFLLLIAGAAMLIVAYAYPKPSLEEKLIEIDASNDDDGNIFLTMENIRDLLHDRFHYIKLAGVVLLGVGAAAVAVSIIPPACGVCMESNASEGVRAWVGPTTDGDVEQLPYSPTSKVPVDSRTTTVQPSAEEMPKKTIADNLLLFDEKQ